MLTGNPPHILFASLEGRDNRKGTYTTQPADLIQSFGNSLQETLALLNCKSWVPKKCKKQ